MRFKSVISICFDVENLQTRNTKQMITCVKGEIQLRAPLFAWNLIAILIGSKGQVIYIHGKMSSNRGLLKRKVQM